MVDRVGQRLGNYLLTRLLGRGGFAEVYLGEHQRLKTLAAIKVLHTQLADEDIEHFLSEAQTIASLEHPHIVRVLDFDVYEGRTPFLVMSYAPNGNLRQRHLRGTAVPLPTIIGYVQQIVEGLQYAHEQRVIHRDIKPENMLVGRHQELLVSDFGIALIAQSSQLQSTKEVAGTAYYMAPEQIQGRPRLASDQYSLGVVVYEWLCGSRPFQGSFSEIATQHVLMPPPPLRERLPELPPEVENVVNIALAKDPRQRFNSVRAFATALEQASQPHRSSGGLAGFSPPRSAPLVDPPIASSLSGGSIAGDPSPQSLLPPRTPDTVPPPSTANLAASASMSGGTVTPPIVTRANRAETGAPSSETAGSEQRPKFAGAAALPPQRNTRSYLLDIGIILVMSILLFVGVASELSEMPEVPSATTDVTLYECYASIFWQGNANLRFPLNYECDFLRNGTDAPPLRALPREYPFLSIVVFMQAFIGPSSSYQVKFALWMALAGAIIYILLLRYRSRSAARAFALYLVLGAWGTADGRYDLVPAALTLGAMLCASRAKWGWAFSLLALATLLKFYAVILVPPLLIAQQAQLTGSWRSWSRWKAFASFIGICAGVTLLSLAISVEGTLSPLRYFFMRPVQIESLPASILWLGSFFGSRLAPVASFDSFNFLSPLSPTVITGGTLCLIGGVIYVCWLQRRGKIDLYMASLLLLLLLLITSKVFSSQYLIWVLPFVAYVGKGNWKWLVGWGIVAFLTTCIFPFLYDIFFALNFVDFLRLYLVVAVRNALLATITCMLLYQAARYPLDSPIT